MNIYNEDIRLIFKNAEIEARKTNSPFVYPAHLILSLIKTQSQYNQILKKYINYDKLLNNIKSKKKDYTITLYSNETKKIIENIIINAKETGKDSPTIKDLILELLNNKTTIIIDNEINEENLITEINNIKEKSNKNIIKYGKILNNDNNAYNICCRDKEINQIIEILARKNKNNPILIGPPGTGKTAIIEHLAYLINTNKVPITLKDKLIISISMGELISGTKYRGEFEEKLINILKEVEDNPNIILFIDEIHTIINAGGAEGAIDASNILKPLLARGKIKCIGTTTTEEYKKYIEKDKALERRFQKVLIDEPTTKETTKILKNIKKDYEEFHNVKIDDNTINLIVNLSNKYIQNRYQPDKSIDILDQVCAKSNIINCNKLNNNIEILNKKEIEALNNNNYKELIKIKEKKKKYNTITSSKNINKNNIKFILEENTKCKIIELENIKDYKNNIINKMIKKIPKEKNNIIEFTNKIINKNNINMFTCNNKNIINIIDTYSKINNIKVLKMNSSQYNNINSLDKILGINNTTSIFDSIKYYPNQIIYIEDLSNFNDKIYNILLDIFKNQYLYIDNIKIKFNLCTFIIILNEERKSYGFVDNLNIINNNYNINNFIAYKKTP